MHPLCVFEKNIFKDVSREFDELRVVFLRAFVCERCVCCHIVGTHGYPEERCSSFSKAAAQPRSNDSSTVSSSGTATAAVQQQRYNGSRASSSSYLCAGSQDVCVWLVQSRRPNHDNICMSNASIAYIVGPLSTHPEFTARAKTVARVITGAYQWNARVSPFRLKTPRGYQGNPIPKGSLVRRVTYTAWYPVDFLIPKLGPSAIGAEGLALFHGS